MNFFVRNARNVSEKQENMRLNSGNSKKKNKYVDILRNWQFQLIKNLKQKLSEK